MDRIDAPRCVNSKELIEILHQYRCEINNEKLASCVDEVIEQIKEYERDRIYQFPMKNPWQ